MLALTGRTAIIYILVYIYWPVNQLISGSVDTGLAQTHR